MLIQADTRQKPGKHTDKEIFIASAGYKIVHCKCLVGDYIIAGDASVAVDTKAGLDELYENLVHEHPRFRAECILAKEAGIKLCILVEEPGIKSLEDVASWENPKQAIWETRKKQAEQKGEEFKLRPPVSSETLAKTMQTMEQRYGCKFYFCTPEKAGACILWLLENHTRNKKISHN